MNFDSSRLFSVLSRKQLARQIGWHGSVTELEQFVRRGDNYRPYPKKKPNGKIRMIEPPKLAMMELHRTIFQQISSITPPSYLHSGVKGRSYQSNARAHEHAPGATITMDLESFYTSTKWGHVFRFFRRDLGCSPDVAGLLASICSFEKHLPTGSPVSQTLAFWAHRDMFEEINQFVVARGGVLTVYVDDLTITMECASAGDATTVRHIIERHGLAVNGQKTRVYRARDRKQITGHVIHHASVSAPNRKHSDLKALRLLCGSAAGTDSDRRTLVGKLEHIAQLDIRISSHLRAEAKGLRRSLAAPRQD